MGIFRWLYINNVNSH